jgi:hypothetical protein
MGRSMGVGYRWLVANCPPVLRKSEIRELWEVPGAISAGSYITVSSTTPLAS